MATGNNSSNGHRQSRAAGVVPGVKNGWYTDTATLWPGQKFSLALENFSNDAILFHEKSEFQDIAVFQSAQYGRCLVIDGILQLTERDEFVYHEMMAHVALCSHRNPENVLIVGGGDGGILREVCRDENVKHITLVEIDPMVIDVTKRYLQNIVPTSIFDDPRLEIIHVDGAEFVQDLATSAADTDDNSNNDGSQIQSQQQQQADSTTDSNRTSLRYDVILADTLDPLGPAESLFEPEFYEAMHTVLRDDGLICTQGECFWIHLDLIRDLLGCCTDIYDYAEYASTMIPSAPCGQMGFIVARKLPRHHNHLNKNARRSFRIPLRTPNFQSDLRWYNSQVHQAAFVLPEYIRRELGQLSHDVSSNDDEDDGEDPGRCFLSECTIL